MDGSQVELSGAVSSQYLTALLMAAPLATGPEGVHIRIKDELVSQPYVDMTVRLMERFGVTVRACLTKGTSAASTAAHLCICAEGVQGAGLLWRMSPMAGHRHVATEIIMRRSLGPSISDVDCPSHKEHTQVFPPRQHPTAGHTTQEHAAMCSKNTQVNRLDGLQHMHIPSGQTYQSPGEAYVEGDASSASYFLAGAHALCACPPTQL